MIGKIKKGRSFGGCTRYVTQKDDAKIIASEGVLLGTAEEMARSFRWQCLLNPDVAKPVGHIALSFKPEDAPRLTDAFMARLAEEYLELMGIRNTQFIVVRHHGTGNPHCHIVFNRVDFDGKVISDSNDFRRNERVTKMLKEKFEQKNGAYLCRDLKGVADGNVRRSCPGCIEDACELIEEYLTK